VPLGSSRVRLPKPWTPSQDALLSVTLDCKQNQRWQNLLILGAGSHINSQKPGTNEYSIAGWITWIFCILLGSRAHEFSYLLRGAPARDVTYSIGSNNSRLFLNRCWWTWGSIHPQVSHNRAWRLMPLISRDLSLIDREWEETIIFEYRSENYGGVEGVGEGDETIKVIQLPLLRRIGYWLIVSR
jgi:hypothetical protein